MLLKTYERINELFAENHGYMSFKALREEKITITQMNELVDNGVLERFSRGWYWYKSGQTKPENYRMLEISMVNPKAVICAESACYYWGLLKHEPEKLSFATKRTDRSGMEVNFPVSRHFFSDYAYTEDVNTVETPYGAFKVYGIDKSVCDCIRFRDEISDTDFKTVISAYKQRPESQIDRTLFYADQMRIGRIARKYLE